MSKHIPKRAAGPPFTVRTAQSIASDDPQLRGGVGAHVAPTRRGKSAVSQKRLDAFIEALAGSSNATQASRISGLPPTTARRYRREDKVFARRWEQALAEGIADLRMRAVEQARFGATTTETVELTDAGRVTTTIRQCAVQSLREIERMLELLATNADSSDAKDRASFDARVESLTVNAIAQVIEKMLAEQQAAAPSAGN